MPYTATRPEYLESRHKKALLSHGMTHEDDQIIRQFLNERQAVHNVSLPRVDRMDSDLVAFRKFFTAPYQDATWDDLLAAINAMRDSEKYKQNTYRFLVANLKMFYLWMAENQFTSIPANKIASIKTPKIDRMTKTADDLLSSEEVARMVAVCTNSRDRALVSVLFDSGCRGIEIATLTWRQVKFDEFGAVLNTDEKTGQPRYIRLVGSAEYLKRWKTDHPDPRPDAVVFTSFKRKGEGISHGGLYSHLKRIAKRAGVNDKRIGPHLFRHSRVTELIRAGWSSEIIKKMLWGKTDTAMFSTYLHLVNEDIDKEVLEKTGLITAKREKKEDPMAPRQCPKCLKLNGPLDKFCPECGQNLTADAAADETDTLRILIDLAKRDPEGLVDALKKLG